MAAARPDWLAAAAARAPRAVALKTAGAQLTYRELNDDAGAAARELQRRGVARGDRVAIALPGGMAFVEALHACLRLGAVAMPVDVRLAECEQAAQVASAAAIVDAPLTHEDREAALDQPHQERGDVAVVVHTSGTSGAPRPVELTYGNWESAAAASARRLGTRDDERWLCVLPLSHVGGLSILVRSAIAATTAVLHERFEVEAVARALAGGDVTIVSLVPTTLARLLDAGVEPRPSLRCALVGGAPLPAPLAQRALDAGYPVAHTYGLTEACSQVATSAVGKPWTAGAPLEGTTVEIAEDGEILVAGPTVAPGATARDGFLHTGDLGRLDDDGGLVVTGRRTDTIVTGGENVAAAEVEAVLVQHPAVAEAAVHGRPDPEWGQAVVATVVLRPEVEASAQQLRAHCAAALAGFKVPKDISFTRSIPRTASGKVRRDHL